MEVIEKSYNKIKFIVKAKESLINAIRRSIFEIPIIAIDDVEFIKNDSVLYDEVLALRLGLIPLKNLDLTLPEKCKCGGKGCSACTLTLKLEAKGPCTVYARDLKGKVEVVYGDMPIVELSKDQELILVAKARLGKGKQHTKYTPGLFFYSYTPEIVEEKSEKEGIEVSEEEFEKIKRGEEIAYDYLDEIVSYKDKKIYVKPNKENIRIVIESWGQISAKEIFEKAIETLKKNLKEIIK